MKKKKSRRREAKKKEGEEEKKRNNNNTVQQEQRGGDRRDGEGQAERKKRTAKEPRLSSVSSLFAKGSPRLFGQFRPQSLEL